MKEGLKVTLNNKNYQNILFQSRDTIVTMSKFVTKKRIWANFIVLYLPTASRYRRTFFSFELFEDRLSATDMKSLTIYILKFHFKSMTSFSHQNYKQQKI